MSRECYDVAVGFTDPEKAALTNQFQTLVLLPLNAKGRPCHCNNIMLYKHLVLGRAKQHQLNTLQYGNQTHHPSTRE